MSLLKGIVFIPREKKPDSISTAAIEDRSHDKKRKSKDHKKSRSTEIKGHKKHKRDNEKSSKRIQENRDSSSDDDDDHTDFSKYEKEINLMAARDNDVDDTSSSHSTKRLESTDYEINQTAKEIDSKSKKSSFSSLIGSLKSKTISQSKSSPTNTADNSDISKKINLNDDVLDADGLSSNRKQPESFVSEQIHEEHFKRSVEILKDSPIRSMSNNDNDTSSKYTTENPPVKEKSMNQSVAEQFRAKLKAKNSFQSESRSLIQLIEDEEREADNNLLFENIESMRAQVINKVRSDSQKSNRDKQTEGGIKNNSNPSKSVEIDMKNQRKEFSNQRSDMNKLMQSEKFGQNDMDENFRENVLRLGERYKGTELGKMGAFGNGDLTGQDEEEEIDMKMFENKFEVENDSNNKKSKKQTLKKIGNDNKRDGNSEIEKLDAKQREILNRCPHCSDSSAYEKHLTVSTGEHTRLRLKAGSNVLGPMHCIITPITHTASILKCEDDVEVEVTRYKSCLQRMYERNGQSVLFLESALGFGKHPHACIDVVPIPLGMEGEARMSFREVSTRTCMYVCLCVYMYMCCMWVCVCMCIHVCEFTSKCPYVRAHYNYL